MRCARFVTGWKATGTVAPCSTPIASARISKPPTSRCGRAGSPAKCPRALPSRLRTERAMESRDIHVLGRQALALHSQGRHGEAETLYRRILAIDPLVFPALYLLGVTRLEQGDSAEAAHLMERALKL